MQLRRLLFLALALGQLAAGSAWSETPAQDRTSLERRARQSSDSFYDEVFDQEGKIRPQYEDIWAIYSRIDRSVLETFRSTSTQDFQRDNALSALPKALTETEFKELRRGVDQRAKAALLFLEDHYSGTKKYLKAKLIPANVMQAVMERSGEALRPEFLKPLASQLSFPYGSDLIRGADGKFYEIEFNSGFVGGFGDIRLARRILFERIPEYQNLLSDTPDPAQFYKNLLARYRKQMKDPNDLMVFLSVPPYADHEENRLIQIWNDLGVLHVKPGETQKLVNSDDGLYLEVSPQRAKALGWEAGQTRRKVGFAIVNAEHVNADPTHAVTEERYWLEVADNALEDMDITQGELNAIRRAMRPDKTTGRVDVQKLIEALAPSEDYRNAGFAGLIDSILSQKVATNYTPGSELLSDKEFHTYFEDIIRFYLNEEPVIKNLPTERFYISDANGRPRLNQALLDDTMNNLDQYVVKIVDGRGGVGVWVGSKVSASEKIELAKLIAAEPERYIRQKFMHLSTMDRDITDIRMLAQVGPLEGANPAVEISEVPWARALPIDGNGKVNLSGDGHEVAVFVRRDGTYPKRPAVKALLSRPCPIMYKEILSVNY